MFRDWDGSKVVCRVLSSPLLPLPFLPLRAGLDRVLSSDQRAFATFGEASATTFPAQQASHHPSAGSDGGVLQQVPWTSMHDRGTQ